MPARTRHPAGDRGHGERRPLMSRTTAPDPARGDGPPARLQRAGQLEGRLHQPDARRPGQRPQDRVSDPLCTRAPPAEHHHVETQGRQHAITIRRRSDRPGARGEHVISASSVKTGTRVTLPVGCLEAREIRPAALTACGAYSSSTRSHAYRGRRRRLQRFERTVEASPSGSPANPQRPLVYAGAAPRADGRVRERRAPWRAWPMTVRDFIGEFKGLSSTMKRKAHSRTGARAGWLRPPRVRRGRRY